MEGGSPGNSEGVHLPFCTWTFLGSENILKGAVGLKVTLGNGLMPSLTLGLKVLHLNVVVRGKG